MTLRSRSREARHARAGGRVARARLAILVLVLAAPAAAAQLPVSPPVTPPTSPSVETPSAPAPEELSIDEHGFVFEGSPADPSLVRVRAPDGATALEYAVDGRGSARLDIAGSNVIADATLVTVVGAPTGNEFSIYLRDAEGNIHNVTVDRVELAKNTGLPLDQQKPAVEVARPPAWPGAPSAPFAVYVEDEAGTHVAASKLDGDPWLQRGGKHTVGLQVPLAEADFTRIYLEASRRGQPLALEADFVRVDATPDAAVYEAAFTPALLGAKDGQEVELQVLYERRVSPLVIERFPEAVVYAYRLDGTGPTLTLDAPTTSQDFRFTIAWSGRDEDSGLRGVSIDQREGGAAQWTPWLVKSAPKSATFSGDWGRTYELRAVAFDAVGNPSAPVLATVAIAAKPGATLDVNDPPTGDIISPRAGALVAGAAEVRWSASDPDGTPLTSTLEMSRDSGRTWRLLYSGEATQAPWDTRAELDGAGYRLRLTVSDGARSATDEVGALTVRNVVALPPAEEDADPGAPPAGAAPAEPLAPAQGDADALAAEGGESKDVPAPFVGAALLAAALLARRRRA